MKKKIVFAAAIVIAIAVVAFAIFTNEENGIKFGTEKASRGAIVASVTASGTVNAVTTVLVGTQVSGTIKSIYADFNSPVKKGQLIALIDPAAFEAQVEQAKANLLSANANVAKAEASLADSRRTMERNRELYAKNFIARSELDTSGANYEVASAQVQAARAQAAQAVAALKLAQTNLRYARIVSPVDGIVISRNVDVGQTVAASFQTPTLFTIAQDLTKMQINSSVAEADIGKVKLGQPVEFTVDAYPDFIFRGKVSEIRNAPITVQNVVTYDVIVKVDNPELKLKPGMTANVSIIVDNKENIIRIPNAALRFKLPEKSKTAQDKKEKGSGVWVVEGKKPKRIKVTVGISDGNYTELISGDIREGQELIVESTGKSKKAPSAHSGPRMF